MTGDVGIAIANSRGSMEDPAWGWDSRKKKMAIDLKTKPTHLDLIEIDGGTVWTISPGQRREETIFEIEHKMPFKPKVLAYFYLYDAPFERVSMLGSHSMGIAPMVFNAVNLGSEWLVADVDEKYFRIKHMAAGGLAGGKLLGNTLKYRLRYEITNLRHIPSRASAFYT